MALHDAKHILDTKHAACNPHSPQHRIPQQHSHVRAANALTASNTGPLSEQHTPKMVTEGLRIRRAPGPPLGSPAQ